MKPYFRTKNGIAFRALPLKSLENIQSAVVNDYGISWAQTTEAASFSMAMVIRSALALDAHGGKIAVVANNSLSGCVALGALRHLVCGGALGIVIIANDGSPASKDFEIQLKPLQKMGVLIEEWSSSTDNSNFEDLLSSCHTVVCGLFNRGEYGPLLTENILPILNEISTPIHAIEAPPGIDPDTGEASSYALFASSTLSLGAPLAGLHLAHDHVGRHYLCDISIAPSLYETEGPNLAIVFSEQPVVQIYPVTEEIKE